VGLLKGVHCVSPNLDLTVSSRATTLTLHADNYRIRFTALNFDFTGELGSCTDLENRTARVEYLESTDKTDAPHLIAVELQNESASCSSAVPQRYNKKIVCQQNWLLGASDPETSPALLGRTKGGCPTWALPPDTSTAKS
jgi:hypothetical protein